MALRLNKIFVKSLSDEVEKKKSFKSSKTQSSISGLDSNLEGASRGRVNHISLNALAGSISSSLLLMPKPIISFDAFHLNELPPKNPNNENRPARFLNLFFRCNRNNKKKLLYDYFY